MIGRKVAMMSEGSYDIMIREEGRREVKWVK